MKRTLNGNRIRSIGDFHKEVKTLLEFPDYYGENLDALWDCITGYIELPLTLIWKDFEISRKNIGDYANTAMSLFKEAEKEVKGFQIEVA